MKIRALKTFEGIKDLERDVFPKEGDVWETTKERAEFLKSHGVVEFVEEDEVSEEVVQAVAEGIVEEAKEQDKTVNEIVDEIIEEAKEIEEEKPKETKNKKASKK